MPYVFLGDLGDVGTAERLRAAASAGAKRAVESGEAQDSSAAPLACTSGSVEELGLVIVASAGTGTVGGEPVTVIVGTAPAGTEAAIVLRSADCLELLRVKLTADLGRSLRPATRPTDAASPPGLTLPGP